MKKLLALVLILIISISCKPKVVEKIIEVDREVGYLLTPEKTFTASSGDNSIVELWDKYIKAHNNRDLESIIEMNSDSIQIYGPHGEIIQGNDDHISFLKVWFEDAAPEWKTFFISYEGKCYGITKRWSMGSFRRSCKNECRWS